MKNNHSWVTCTINTNYIYVKIVNIELFTLEYNYVLKLFKCSTFNTYLIYQNNNSFNSI